MAKIAGRTFDDKIIEAGFAAMCSDIGRERRRMGGDWVIASVLDNKKIRKFVRYFNWNLERYYDTSFYPETNWGTSCR